MSAAMRTDQRRIAFVMALAMASVSAGGAAADPVRADGARDRGAFVIDALAVPTTSPVVIDGNLDEAVWRDAPVIGEFVQREPTEGAPPSERTEARVAYDSDSLFVAIRAFDREPARIAGLLTRRDERSPSDWVRVAIDSFHDRRSAYEFAVNPAGVKADRYHFNDGQTDDGWDAVWDVQVARDNDGWRAEFRIPFSQLRFSTVGGPVGFAVIREYPRANETSSWPLIARSAQGYVSQFGEVNGLRPGGSPKRLELLPYALGEFVRDSVEEGDPLSKANDPGASLGVDLKYAVTPALTLTATLNPDFGQVEADPAAVNLEAAELFFSERRPFFVEGSGIFRFNIDCNDGECTGLLYSRRIGRVPQGDPDTADGEYFHAPATTTILGAAKLTGRIGAFSVGALSAATQEERGAIASHPLEPPAGGRAVDRLQRPARPSRVHQPLQPRRDADQHEPPIERGHPLPGRTGRHRRRRLRLAARRALQPVGLLGGEPRRRRRRGDHQAAGERGALLPAARRRPHRARRIGDVARRARRDAERVEDWRRESALQRQLRLQEPGVRDQRPRFPASRRRAHDQPLGAVARRRRRASTSGNTC